MKQAINIPNTTIGNDEINETLNEIIDALNAQLSVGSTCRITLGNRQEKALRADCTYFSPINVYTAINSYEKVLCCKTDNNPGLYCFDLQWCANDDYISIWKKDCVKNYY